MKLRDFFSELKRRKVYRVAVAYAVVGWLLIQVVTQVLPFFIPVWLIRLAIGLVVAGFPVALILAWLFDLTPQGVRRTDAAELAANEIRTDLTQTRRAASTPNKSVAVLPFENLSEHPENAYFAEGIHDDILTTLARIADLKVISRTSVQQYRTGQRNLREIADCLGVAHILQGTVRRFGNRIRVNAQLINAATDTLVWGDSFDRELTDLFAIQTELAERISTALRANLSPQEKANLQIRPTHDLTAYELYLRARSHFHWSGVGDAQESGERALPLLEEAIARDPNFALAYVLSARVHAELYWFGYDKQPSRLKLARAAAAEALRLQPNLGEAHLALAFYHYYAKRDYDRARAELISAQRIIPNDSDVIAALAIIDRRQGRWNEALKNLQRARELDPRNMATIWSALEIYIYTADYSEAEKAIADGLRLNPNAHFLTLARASLALRRDGDATPLRQVLSAMPRNFDPGGAVTMIAVRVALMEHGHEAAATALARCERDWLNDVGLSGLAGALDGYVTPRSWFEGLIARERGDAAEAKRAFELARGQLESAVRKSPDDAKTHVMLGLVLGALNIKDAALRHAQRAAELLPVAFDSIDGPVVATNVAAVFAAVDETDQAIAQLKTLVNQPAGPTSGLLRIEPEWDPLRDHPLFQQLANDT